MGDHAGRGGVGLSHAAGAAGALLAKTRWSAEARPESETTPPTLPAGQRLAAFSVFAFFNRHDSRIIPVIKVQSLHFLPGHFVCLFLSTTVLALLADRLKSGAEPCFAAWPPGLIFNAYFLPWLRPFSVATWGPPGPSPRPPGPCSALPCGPTRLCALQRSHRDRWLGL